MYKVIRQITQEEWVLLGDMGFPVHLSGYPLYAGERSYGTSNENKLTWPIIKSWTEDSCYLYYLLEKCDV